MRKLLGLLWVILIGTLLIGCDSNNDDIESIQEDIILIQEQLGQMQAAQTSNAAIIAKLQKDLNNIDPEDTEEILRWMDKYDEMLAMLLEEYIEWVNDSVQAEYTAQFNMEYRGTLNTENYKDVFQLTIPASGTIYIVINTDQKFDINFYHLGDTTWYDYTTFSVSSTEAIYFEAGTYLFEVENWYNYPSVIYTIQFNQATR